MKKNKKYFIAIIVVVILAILLPVALDIFFFGNDIPSNLDNSDWAGFLGGYIGGVATIVGVLMTIIYTNKLNDIEEKKRKEEDIENKRLTIRPYLYTRYTVAHEDDNFEINDRVFVIVNEKVTWLRFGLNDEDKHFFKKMPMDKFYIKYQISNVGMGSAIEMVVNINGFDENYALINGQIANLYLLATINTPPVRLKININYWDAEKIGHYEQEETLVIFLNNGELVSKSENAVPIHLISD